MVRTILILGLLGLFAFGVYKWGTTGDEPLVDNKQRTRPTPEVKSPRETPETPRTERPAEKRPAANPKVYPVAEAAQSREPLIIPDARISLVKNPELAAQRNGRLLFLGTEIPRDQVKDEETLRRLGASKVKVSFLAVPTTLAEAMNLKEEAWQIPGDTKLWRRWLDTDPIEPEKVKICTVEKWFHPLKQGTVVAEGQLLGMIDPRLSVAEMHIKIAKLSSSEADLKASVKTRDESKVRYERQDRLVLGGSGGSKEERDAALLGWQRYIEEVKGKEAALEVARREIIQADAVMKQHEIRAPIAGITRRPLKQPDEAVKEGDPVVRVENFDQFTAEGFIEEQHRRRLTPRMEIIVEPTRREGPVDRLRGHREPITAVAVSGGKDPYVLSAGEDRTVRVWRLRSVTNTQTGREQWQGEEAFVLSHSGTIVRSLACTPPGAARSLCLSGGSDGSGILWDLEHLGKEGSWTLLEEGHRGPILTCAFSPDGEWVATGSEDKAICIWKTENGKLSQRISDAHTGAVTSLTFTAEGLVSAGRDNRLILWTVKEGKAEVAERIPQRGGQVAQLGAVVDEKQLLLLFDQGNELRILSPSGRVRGIVRNPSGSVNFTTFALFSPDGRTILTAGSNDNRLQLWTNPLATTVKDRLPRASEMRQYIWNEGASTCAAFDPKNRFAVTGTRDRQILIWQLPSEAELQEPEIKGTLSYVGQSIDSSRLVNIIVEVPHSSARLLSGDKASLIINPR